MKKIAGFLLILSLLHPAHAMEGSGVPDIVPDIEEGKTSTSKTAEAPPTPHPVTPTVSLNTAIRLIELFTSRTTPEEHHNTLRVPNNSPDIEDLYDRAENGAGRIVDHPNQRPASATPLGGGLMGFLPQDPPAPDNHFTDSLKKEKDQYYERLFCLLDIGEGWLGLMQQACNLGSGAVSLYITASAGSVSHELPPVILGFNVAAMVITGLLSYAQNRKKTLKEKGYDN